jgi:ribosome-associated translation inhibitor RaiA
MKLCKKCKETKELSKFSKNKNSKDGFVFECKECKKSYDTERYKNNREILLDKTKQYQEKNKTQVLEYQKQWYTQNKDKVSNYHVEYRKNNKEKIQLSINRWISNKKKNDIFYASFSNMRNRIYQALRKGKGKKSQKTLEYLGCELDFYKQYLEQLFLPEMNWENYGLVWEIDHIIACTKFDLTQEKEQKKAFHYTNTQPLFKTSEIAKSFGYNNQIGNRNKNKN